MENKPNMGRIIYRDGYGVLTVLEQIMMGDITGKKFNRRPFLRMNTPATGLPRFGQSDEENKISLENAKLILENSDFFEEYCKRSKQDKENAEYSLLAIIRTFEEKK